MSATHGIPATYWRGCRCDACRKAASAYSAERRAKQAPLAADDPRHGTANGYSNLKCRCERCTNAWAVWHREWETADPNRMRRKAQRRRLYDAAKRRTAGES